MTSKKLLEKLSNSSTVSGYEDNASEILRDYFQPITDEHYEDKLGNLSFVKKGTSNNIKIMLAAHIDEIGLMVKDIDELGFIYFTSIGGIDPRTILAQEVIVHGKEDYLGIIGTKPPHLQDPAETGKAIKMEDMSIDIGYGPDYVKENVQIGDLVTINRQLLDLQAERVAGKALDNKAGVAVMYEACKELEKLKHEANVYFVASVQEEIGCRGAEVSTYSIDPHIGIAVDVGFGRTPELKKSDSLELGKGPGITLGGNIHPELRKHLVKIAKEYNIPFQTEVDPGPTGTDGSIIQITRAGVPTLVLSIPLKYMHTSVELLDMKDVSHTAKLLAQFIASINEANLEGLLCY